MKPRKRDFTRLKEKVDLFDGYRYTKRFVQTKGQTKDGDHYITLKVTDHEVSVLTGSLRLTGKLLEAGTITLIRIFKPYYLKGQGNKYLYRLYFPLKAPLFLLPKYYSFSYLPVEIDGKEHMVNASGGTGPFKDSVETWTSTPFSILVPRKNGWSSILQEKEIRELIELDSAS